MPITENCERTADAYRSAVSLLFYFIAVSVVVGCDSK